mgnify:CR=1 FL=1
MGYREIINGEPKYFEEPDFSQTYTAQEYYEWPYDGMFELINGRVIDKNQAYGPNHQTVSGNLASAIFPLLNRNIEVFLGPLDVYLIEPHQNWRQATTVVQPDILVPIDAHKIKHHGCVGSPNFIVEVVTIASSIIDYREKFEVYQQFGIDEYWIADIHHKCIIRNILKEGKYEIQRAAFAEEIISPQQFPDLRIKVEEVFEGIREFDE